MTSKVRPRRRFSRSRAAATGLFVASLGAAGLVGAQSAEAAISIDTGAYYVIVNANSGKAIDNYGWSTVDGGEFRQWTRTNADNQKFQFVSSGNGSYRLKNKFSGKVLDVWGWSKSDGAEIRQFSDANAANQQFKLTGSGNSAVRFINVNSGKALEVWAWGVADGDRLSQYTDLSGANQTWNVVKVGTAGSTPTTTSSGSSGTSPNASWPNPSSTVQLSSTQTVSGTFDGGGKRYNGWGGGQSEGQAALFTLADGATIKNVVIGSAAGDGIHCKGSCTIQNVWWEDVGEDAATLEKSAGSSATMTIDGGGAKAAADKVFQHNGDGKMVIKNFQASSIGKLYRSCGNCSTQFSREVVVQNVKITTPAATVVYINTNLGDKATLSGLTIVNDSSKKVVICRWSKGVTSGEPSEIGSGVSSQCVYTPSAIVYK